MKISTFALSISALCTFYIFHSDWIDDLYDSLVEDYFGSDYEEVAPFISSADSGAEEFDNIVEQLSKPQQTSVGPYVAAGVVGLLTCLLVVIRLMIFRRGLNHLCWSWVRSEKPEQKADAVGKRRRLRTGRTADDVPVQVIWKGSNLMESSVHCNLKDGSEAGQPKKKDPEKLTASSSTESTVQRLSEIRKLLESEPEIANKASGTEDLPREAMTQLRQRLESQVSVAETEGADPKLMNRIRLLENRLRLEELKNQNWISRMSRAEGILQQLNKQVERIEQARPMQTLTKTLKITSTVTNWLPQPSRNLQLTLVKRYPPQFLRPQYESLSDIIRREVGLSRSCLDAKRMATLVKSPLMPPLPSPMPQPSILSKFLSK